MFVPFALFHHLLHNMSDSAVQQVLAFISTIPEGVNPYLALKPFLRVLAIAPPSKPYEIQLYVLSAFFAMSVEVLKSLQLWLLTLLDDLHYSEALLMTMSIGLRVLAKEFWFVRVDRHGMIRPHWAVGQYFHSFKSGPLQLTISCRIVDWVV